MFFTHPRESIGYHYERNPGRPAHRARLTLEVDEFGNVLKSAAVAYGRRQPIRCSTRATSRSKASLHITYAENRVTNAIDEPDDYRAPLPCESRTYELTGLTCRQAATASPRRAAERWSDARRDPTTSRRRRRARCKSG